VEGSDLVTLLVSLPQTTIISLQINCTLANPMFTITSSAVIVAIRGHTHCRQQDSSTRQSVADNDVVCDVGVFKKGAESAAFHQTEENNNLFVAILSAKLDVVVERANPTPLPPTPRPALVPLPPAEVEDLGPHDGQKRTPTTELVSNNELMLH
jgi:hypothetical protein